MSRDLDQLLHDTAPAPERQPDPAGLVRRGRRRRRRRHAAGAASALAAVLAVTAVGLQAWPEPTPEIVDQPDTEQPTPAPTESAAPGDGTAASACGRLQPSTLPSGAATGGVTQIDTDYGPGRSWGEGRDEVTLIVNEAAWAAAGGRDEFLHGATVDSPDDSTRQVIAVGDFDGTPVQIHVRDGDCDLLLWTTVSYDAALEYASLVTFDHADDDGPDDPDAAPACATMRTWTQLPAAFYVCDRPGTNTVGVPATDQDASLQDLLDQLATVPPAAQELGLTTVFDGINPPTVTIDGTNAVLDFDETLHSAFAQAYTQHYVLEQALTTVWVHSGVDTIQVTIEGDCEAASAALESVTCHTYERSDGNNTLMEAAQFGLAAKTDRLNQVLERMITDAGYEPLGGDHDYQNATNTIDDGTSDVFLTLWYGTDYATVKGEVGVDDGFDWYGGQDGGGAYVLLGTMSDGAHTAILECNDLLLVVDTGDTSDRGRERAARLAGAFEGDMGCAHDM